MCAAQISLDSSGAQQSSLFQGLGEVAVSLWRTLRNTERSRGIFSAILDPSRELLGFVRSPHLGPGVAAIEGMLDATETGCMRDNSGSARLVAKLIVSALLLLGPGESDAESVKEHIGYAGHQLPREPGLYYRWDPERSWGTSILVNTLRDVSEELAWRLPGAQPLLIGDISRRGGGLIFGHKTHHAGVDVDIGLFAGEGEQPYGGFVDVAPSHLDVRATWILIRTLLNTDRVSFILLDQAHIDRLKAHLIRDFGVEQSLVETVFPRTAASAGQRGAVHHAPNHRSHMHVRITPRQ